VLLSLLQRLANIPHKQDTISFVLQDAVRGNDVIKRVVAFVESPPFVIVRRKQTNKH
jgi:hypothetical protein